MLADAREMTFRIPIEAVSITAAVTIVAQGLFPDSYSYGYAQRHGWRVICTALLDGALRAFVVDAHGETHAAYRPQFAGLQDRDPFDVDQLLMRAEGSDMRGRLFFFPTVLISARS